MKYLLVLAIVLAVFWYWRANRRGDASREGPAGAAPKSPPGAATRQPQDMVQCPVCLVHLPRTDALPGPGGRLYCCAEHRLRAGS
ncbi:MAG TPA: PP0621 family protein [Ramlibacter sp.]|nr:PP0621 family protein [Ramlibacter sp.]